MRDYETLLHQLSTRPVRITMVLRVLHWDTARLAAAVLHHPARFELHTMHGCGCLRVEIGGKRYSHIRQRAPAPAPAPAGRREV